MQKKTVTTIAIVLLVVAVGSAAATISFFMQQSKVTRLENQLATRLQREQELRTRLAEIQAQVAALEAAEQASSATADAANQDATSDTQSTTTQTQGATTTTKQFAFVTGGSKSGGTVSLKLDYADFLTGDAAAAAATKAGAESPPPNDYYISNVNPKIRTFKVKSGAKFTVAGMAPEDTTVLSASDFLDAIEHNTDGAADAGYWITIENDVIISGEEQWAP